MKNIFILFFCLLFISCKKEVENNTNQSDSSDDFSLTLTEKTPPFSVAVNGTKYYSDISYGDNVRNKFDIFLPASNTPTGIVIFIHGGGFVGGDKSVAYSSDESQLIINYLLANNIALATINYQFLELNETVGVLKSLRDSKRALQFIRFHAQNFNIDKEKVVLMGSSAGAGTSLWLAFNSDMAALNAEDKVLRESTRVKGVVAFETQANYDLIEWHNTVFSDYQSQGFNSQTVKDLISEPLLLTFYGASSMAELSSSSITSDRQKLDFLNLMTSDDPEIYLDNSETNNVFPTDAASLLHHPWHAKVLMDKANLVNVVSKVHLPTMGIDTRNGENMTDFVIRKLNE